MKVRCVDAEKFKNVLREGNIYEGELKFHNTFNEKRWEIRGIRKVDGVAFKECSFEEVKELTFKEVIANIKEGEVWVNNTAPIRFIRLRANGALDFNENEGINLECKYILERKKYSFTEAFKAYEEGKEIESIHSGYRYKKVNGVDLYTRGGKEWYEEDDFEIDEIREEWYINE